MVTAFKVKFVKVGKIVKVIGVAQATCYNHLLPTTLI